MLKYLKLKAVIIFSGAMFGCANQDHLKENLKPIISENYIIFENENYYTQKRGVGASWREGVSKGVYRPELSNQHGTFYRGPEGCVSQYLENTSMGPFEGGIWVPKDKINSTPMIYYYFNYNKAHAWDAGGVVIAGILELHKDDITFMPHVDKITFLEKIKITNIPLAPSYK